MANVTDSSSLLVVPSGWSDGVLGSLKPDDGSGDFTFSRGSDLSATRMNQDRYIEKGYENLLLQSNRFDLSTWARTGVDVPIGGQSGYDGLNNAWDLTKTTGTFKRIYQSVSTTGIICYSIYAKAKDSNVFQLAEYGTNNFVTFDLSDTPSSSDRVVSQGNTIIATSFSDEGNGWYRFSIVFNKTGTWNAVVYPGSPNDSNLTSIYIQDAMLNLGLAAYPYIETTNTTAKAATISEDQPRIDYTSGNGAVLIEPSMTNAVKFSEYIKGGSTVTDKSLIFWDSLIVNPEGYNGATRYQSTTVISDGFIFSGLAAGTKISYSIFAKSDSDANFIIGGKFGGEDATFNVRTGTLISQGAACDSYEIIPFSNGWHRYVVNITYQNTQNNGYSYSYLRWYSSAEPIYLWGWQAEKDATCSTSYIPTYGTSSTRVKDTATLTKNVAATGTIYININADSTKTLTFLGGNVSVTQGVNKIALAYSPTALKISHNGSIVQNIARAFDTSSLTEIQLGHRNNFEQTTDSINQFLTLDSFLTDTKLNELTA